MSLIHPVILAGGSGTRLWPLSHADRPKPFLPLVGPTTLFEATLARCADPALFAAPLIVTGAAHLAHVERLLDAGSKARIIVEPMARNTAPAIALAALMVPEDSLLLVCPSDHHIADADAFRAAVASAAGLAREGWLVAFGITPTAPETGYGYIRRGERVGAGYRVERFVEKPDAARAAAFLADGRHSWNGGLFVLRAGSFLAELAAHRPEMAAAVRAAFDAGSAEERRFHPAAAPFAAIRGESVDYAVMENTARAAMVPAAMGWSDIGTWRSVRDARPGDADGNRISGRAELIGCADILVQSDGPRVSVIGLADIAVVVNGDEVLVTSMAGAQAVGQLAGAGGKGGKA